MKGASGGGCEEGGGCWLPWEGGGVESFAFLAGVSICLAEAVPVALSGRCACVCVCVCVLCVCVCANYKLVTYIMYPFSSLLNSI